ncbi:MAG: hypothetical protein ABIP33_11140 [Pseudolysinimonas sp.]
MTAVTLKRWRAGLIVGGAAILLLSVWIVLTTIKPTRYIGIAEWFIAAIIVHDAIIAPVVFGIGVVMRKAGRRIPLAVLAIVQGGLVIGAVFTIVLVPEILAQQHAHLFQTLLPFDYVKNLGMLWVGTVVATAVAVAAYLIYRTATRRLKKRPPAAQP